MAAGFTPYGQGSSGQEQLMQMLMKILSASQQPQPMAAPNQITQPPMRQFTPPQYNQQRPMQQNMGSNIGIRGNGFNANMNIDPLIQLLMQSRGQNIPGADVGVQTLLGSGMPSMLY